MPLVIPALEQDTDYFDAPPVKRRRLLDSDSCLLHLNP